jgi:hypothetical protein
VGVLTIVGVVGAAGAGAGAWMVTPLVSMARKGTKDEQTVAAWRAEADRAAAVVRARRRAAVVASIPAPRTAAHDQLRSPLAG